MGVRRGRRHLAARTAALAAIVVTMGACSNQVVELEYPELEAVPRHPPEQTLVFDADGNQLAVLRREFRERVALEDVPTHVVDAVIAIEDQRFRRHRGIDARAIARAALRNVAADEIREGGSTITQQLVKNLYLPDAPRTPATKLREAILARKLEDEHDKDWILEEYLNTIYFGNGAYGIQAAAETYFREEVSRLTLAQSALLAGMIRSPESLDPSTDTGAAVARRQTVLDAMVQTGAISAQEAAAANETPLDAQPRPSTPEAREPHWVDLVIRELLTDPTFGGSAAERAARLYGGGLRIHTTLHPDLQADARAVLADRLDADDDPDGAIVTVEPATGHILAAASSTSYEELQYDLATQGRRQPGSTFKTFVLAAAITAGWDPEDRISGAQGEVRTADGPWQVRNYSGSSYGRITLADATRASVNAAYARLILDVGPPRVAALAKAMGIRSPVDDRATIALGGLTSCCTPVDMAAAYATLANLGEAHAPTPIDRIEDADGQVVWRPETPASAVLEPSVAFVTTGLLRDVVESGTGRAAAVPGWEVAGKTGTVSDYVDAWFVGYTPTLSTAVWVGHHEGRIPMRWVHGIPRMTGGDLPARMFRDYMTAALAGIDPMPFTLPEQYYRTVEIDPETGLRSAPWCPGEASPVPLALVPTDTCPSPPPPPPDTDPDAGAPCGPAPATEPADSASPPPSPQPSRAPAEPCEPPPGSPSPDSSPPPSESPSPSG